MARHDRDFRARQQFLNLPLQVGAGKAGELQIRHDDVGRLRLDRLQRCFGRFRFRALVAKPLPDRHAKPPDALFVVHNQKSKPQFISHGLPIVFSTASIN